MRARGPASRFDSDESIIKFIPLINTIQSARPFPFTRRKSCGVRGLAIANRMAVAEKIHSGVQFSAFMEESRLVAMRRPN
jgi:hypothetical protein